MVDVTVDPGPISALVATLIERAVRLTLGAEGVRAGEVSVAVLDDAGIRRLNREHLGHDRPTDVLSFALHGEGEPVIGDVYLGADQACRQASEAGIPADEEFARLAVHGTLHVLGWDHPEEAEARFRSAMWRRQEALVAELGAHD